MASLSAVVDEYKMLSQATAEYLLSNYENLIFQFTEFKENTGKVGAYSLNLWQLIAHYLLDSSPLGRDENLLRLILETYIWVASMLVVSSGAFMIGSGCLAPLLGFVFYRGVAGIIGLLLLPLFTYLYLKKRDISEENRRAIVFASTLTSNLLTGFALSTKTLDSYPPTPFLLPLLFSAVILYFADEICDLNRYMFYSMVVATFFVGCVLYGFVFCTTAQYYTYWLLFSAVTVFDLQVKIGRYKLYGVGAVSDYVISASNFTLTSSLLVFVFGANK